MKYGKKLTLKQFRALEGMTQEQLADALNIDRSTIALWESRRIPNLFETFIKMEELFDIRMADDFLMPKA